MIPCSLAFLVSFAFFPEPALAASDPALKGLRVHEISYEGLFSTQSFVIERELLVYRGLPFDDDDLEESAQRLRNLQLFVRVEPWAERSRQAPDQVDVHFQFVEKWTVLPIIKFSGAGDVQSFQLGVYDVNFLGRYLELGAQYGNVATRESGLAWFRDPRFLGGRLNLGVDAASTTRPRTVYDSGGTALRSFVLLRREGKVFLESEIDSRFTLGLGLNLPYDRLTGDGLSVEQTASNRAAGFDPDAEGFSRIPSFSSYFQFGHMDYDNFLADGHVTRIRLTRSLGKWATTAAQSVDIETAHYFRIATVHNLAFRVQLGATSSSRIQDRYYLGGLESVRGYLDGQLSGDSFWLLNTEYRVPVFDHPWLVVEPAAFADFAQIPEWPGLYYSTGGGVRFLCPKIYRMVVRIDYAVHFRPSFGHGVSFGLSQFF